MAERELVCPPEDRYRWARFDNMLPSGNAAFDLQTPEFGSRKAIVPREKLGGQRFVPEQQIELFLLRLTSAGNWICTAWSQEKNPWLNGSIPAKGDEVTGKVVQFIGDWLALVEIRICDTTIEAALSRDHLPEGSGQGIDTTLAIGDQVKAFVGSVNSKQVRVALDAAAWHRAMTKAAHQENVARRLSTVPEKSLWEWKGPGPKQLPLEGRRILFIDDDTRLGASVGRWFTTLGAESTYANDVNTANVGISRKNPTHILLDYHLAQHTDFDAFAETARRSGIPTAIFTASPDTARARAAALGFGLIAKPATLDAICTWIKNPITAEALATKPEIKRAHLQHWSVEVQTDAIIKEANALLDNLCELYKCVCAIWFVEDREGVFELRARSKNVSDAAIEPALYRLDRSILTIALTQQRVIHGRLASNDPLITVVEALGIEHPSYVALPIIRKNMQSRVVIFLKDGLVDEELVERIMAREDHFELLIRAIQQAQHVEQIETFATQGRLAAAALHEVRNILQSIESLYARTKVSLDQGDVRDAASNINALGEDVQRLSSIVEGGLEVVRAERRDLINIDGVVSGVVESMRRIAIDEYQKENISLILESSGSKLVTAISPAPLEQALVNLIGNALYFLPDEVWAQIRVRVLINIDDRQTPIHIDVIDNGSGISARQKLRLFEPRVTAKGRVGTGLGLYVSRNLLRMAGGDLELAETTRWGGTNFRIRLPVLLAPMDDMPRGQ